MLHSAVSAQNLILIWQHGPNLGPVTTGLMIRNNGNIEDVYKVIISSTSASLKADLISANLQPAQVIDNLRLPANSTAFIPFDITLLENNTGK